MAAGAQRTARPPVAIANLRPHQVVLTVRNLDKSIEFYSQFGFVPGTHVAKADGRERISMRSPEAFDFELKLFSNPDPQAPPGWDSLAAELATVGARYLSLLCDDVDAFYERHRTDLNFVRPPKTGMTGCRYAFFTDPDSILLEVYQHNDRED